MFFIRPEDGFTLNCITFVCMINQWVAFIFILVFNQGLFAQNENTVKLLFLGDIMGHGPQIKAAYNNYTKTYNYDSNFKYIQNTFSQADIVIGNLEVTLGTKPYSGYPQFSSPAALAVAIKNAGVHILGTANNHSCDRRKRGILKTIEILDSLEIKHLGTYDSNSTKENASVLLIEENNIKIALLNYTYGTNGIPVPAGTLVSLLDKKAIQSDVEVAKALKPDQIIAYVHWGQQYKDLPSTSQKNWYAYFKSLGVNIVIGSHPHVVEPMHWDKSSNNLVVYSLGNFVSNQRTFPRDGGALFELTLTKTEQSVEIIDAKYILIWVHKQIFENGMDYVVLPVEEFEYKEAYFHKPQDFVKMKRYAKHARKLLDHHNLNVAEKKPFTVGLLQIISSLL